MYVRRALPSLDHHFEADEGASVLKSENGSCLANEAKKAWDKDLLNFVLFIRYFTSCFCHAGAFLDCQVN
jgi:hypothetical protein